MNRLLPKMPRFLVYLTIIGLLCSISLSDMIDRSEAQELTKKDQSAVIKRINSLLEENYVFPDIAKKAGALITSNLKAGAYDTITEAEPFAKRLSEDLYTVANDRHLRVRLIPPRQIERNTEDPRTAALKQQLATNRDNFGFKKVEILDGNVGYVDFRYFAPMEIARGVASQAMRFIENTDAVIFDMRHNGGGNPSMVQYVCSYFFDKPTHLNSLYWRRTDETQEFWTLDNIEGFKRPDVPLFILTSKRTFSGAEEFCYNFQTQKRATLVGETTGGGAHPGATFPINEIFRVFIPTGRAINPVTGINWEGTGVKPDIKTDAGNAFDVAHEKAKESAEIYQQKRGEIIETLVSDLDKAESLFSSNNETEARKLLSHTLNKAMELRLAGELEINALGYEYLENEKMEMATALFKCNVEYYPESSNTYDSLGEAYMKSGKKELSIVNYKHSLELDPGNSNAISMLKKMGVKNK